MGGMNSRGMGLAPQSMQQLHQMEVANLSGPRDEQSELGRESQLEYQRESRQQGNNKGGGLFGGGGMNHGLVGSGGMGRGLMGMGPPMPPMMDPGLMGVGNLLTGGLLGGAMAGGGLVGGMLGGGLPGFGGGLFGGKGGGLARPRDYGEGQYEHVAERPTQARELTAKEEQMRRLQEMSQHRPDYWY